MPTLLVNRDQLNSKCITMKIVINLILILVSAILSLEAKSQEISPPIEVPPVETIQSPSGSVSVMEGVISIKLINKTNAKIRYATLGKNSRFDLNGMAEVTLKNVKVPLSFFFRRLDNGFLQPKILTSVTAGLIEIELDATTDFGEDRTTMWVNQDGIVYFN
jgi:hypothetical protein